MTDQRDRITDAIMQRYDETLNQLAGRSDQPTLSEMWSAKPSPWRGLPPGVEPPTSINPADLVYGLVSPGLNARRRY